MMRMFSCVLSLSLIINLSDNKSIKPNNAQMEKFTCKIIPMIKTWLKKNGLSNKGNIYDLVRKCQPRNYAMDLRKRRTDAAKVEYCEELPRRFVWDDARRHL